MHPDPWSTRLHVACLPGVLCSGGCASLTSSVSPQFPRYVRELPFKADRPVARELHYVLAHFIESNGKMKKPILASNIQDPGRHRGPSFSVATQTVTPGTRWSEIYAARAASARAAGKTHDAAFYSQLSATNLRVETAMANMVGSVNAVFATYGAVVQALAAYAQASMSAAGAALSDWTIRSTGCIGAATGRCARSATTTRITITVRAAAPRCTRRGSCARRAAGAPDEARSVRPARPGAVADADRLRGVQRPTGLPWTAWLRGHDVRPLHPRAR